MSYFLNCCLGMKALNHGCLAVIGWSVCFSIYEAEASSVYRMMQAARRNSAVFCRIFSMCPILVTIAVFDATAFVDSEW